MLIFEPALQERQELATRLLSSALSRRSLANAYLLTGRALADKWLIARRVAAYLNCLSRTDSVHCSCLSKSPDAADYCQNCRWIHDDEHPQAWIVLAGQGESEKIPVEKARQLTEELSKTSRYMRVVIVPKAEQEYLHMAPANALLKNIEEPQDNTLFIMFASSEEQVLPTIVSRSQVLPINKTFNPGIWFSEHEEQAQIEKISSLQSEFIHAARKRLSGTSSLHGSLLKAVSESHELSHRLLALSDDDGYEAETLIDLICSAEQEVLRSSALKVEKVSRYLGKLMDLSENSKLELKHYVKKNNVLETFAYSLTQLRLEYLGDLSLAKN
jgi:hypothetical protein